jgi:hypothetical protein
MAAPAIVADYSLSYTCSLLALATPLSIPARVKQQLEPLVQLLKTSSEGDCRAWKGFLQKVASTMLGSEETKKNLANEDPLWKIVENLNVEQTAANWGPPISAEWKIAFPTALKVFHLQSCIQSITRNRENFPLKIDNRRYSRYYDNNWRCVVAAYQSFPRTSTNYSLA